MTSASFTPAMSGRSHGATAVGTADSHPRHRLGSTLRAVRVFARTAFGVAVLGRTDEQTREAAGIRGRRC